VGEDEGVDEGEVRFVNGDVWFFKEDENGELRGWGKKKMEMVSVYIKKDGSLQIQMCVGGRMILKKKEVVS